MKKRFEKRIKRYRVYNSYYEYVENVVNKCGHKYIILDRKDFRSFRIESGSNLKAKLPPGKLIKIIPAKCKSYSCPICGKKKVLDLVEKLKGIDLKNYRFFTLTLQNKFNLDNTEMNLKRISDCFNKLNKALRKKKQYKSLEYFRVIEIGKGGMVHLHGIWNKYIPSVELSKLWHSITKDSFIVKVERIKNKIDAIRYLYKYLTKDVSKKDMLIDPALMNMDITNNAALFYENGKRRYCSSRKFFQAIGKKQSDWLTYYYEGETAQTVENTIKSLVRMYKLKLDNFDFDNYYQSEQFIINLFEQPPPPG